MVIPGAEGKEAGSVPVDSRCRRRPTYYRGASVEETDGGQRRMEQAVFRGLGSPWTIAPI